MEWAVDVLELERQRVVEVENVLVFIGALPFTPRNLESRVALAVTAPVSTGFPRLSNPAPPKPQLMVDASAGTDDSGTSSAANAAACASLAAFARPEVGDVGDGVDEPIVCSDIWGVLDELDVKGARR